MQVLTFTTQFTIIIPMKILVDDVEYKYSLPDLIKSLNITKFGVIKKLRRKNIKGKLLPARRLFTQEEFDAMYEKS